MVLPGQRLLVVVVVTGNVDLFGNEIPDATLVYRANNDFEDCQAVLRIARDDGYTVSGRHCDRIWRREGPTEVVPVPRHEADTVRQLIDTGLLEIGGHHEYRHGTEAVHGKSVLVPKATRRKLPYWEHLSRGRRR